MIPYATIKQNPNDGINKNRSFIKVPTGKTRLLTTEKVKPKNNMLNVMIGCFLN